jgi:glutathione S-transferase
MLPWLNERKRPSEARSAALLAANAVKFAHVIDYLEAGVAELRARPFDIGHITIGCALSYVGFRFPDLTWQQEHPDLASWLADFHRRPSVLAVPVIDDLDAPIQPSAFAAKALVHGSGS